LDFWVNVCVNPKLKKYISGRQARFAPRENFLLKDSSSGAHLDRIWVPTLSSIALTTVLAS
jgi:hypothetical protein